MAGLIGRDPVRMIRAFWKYRWLSAYLATPMMVDKWIEGDRGTSGSVHMSPGMPQLTAWST